MLAKKFIKRFVDSFWCRMDQARISWWSSGFERFMLISVQNCWNIQLIVGFSSWMSRYIRLRYNWYKIMQQLETELSCYIATRFSREVSDIFSVWYPNQKWYTFCWVERKKKHCSSKWTSQECQYTKRLKPPLDLFIKLEGYMINGKNKITFKHDHIQVISTWYLHIFWISLLWNFKNHVF